MSGYNQPELFAILHCELCGYNVFCFFNCSLVCQCVMIQYVLSVLLIIYNSCYDITPIRNVNYVTLFGGQQKSVFIMHEL